MFTKLFDQPVGAETLKVEITYAPDGQAPSVYSLHGGGPSNRRRVDYIAGAFAARGRSVLRFDFSGWGDSTGERSEASLAGRLEESRILSRHLDPDEPVTLIGSSMGAHVAVRLLPFLPVAHLVLFCPAAYGAGAEALPFDGRFTSFLRKPESWADSPVWKILETFRGRLTFVVGTEDSIIPEGVWERYLSSGRHADMTVLRIENAPHALHAWLEHNPDAQARVLESITV